MGERLSSLDTGSKSALVRRALALVRRLEHEAAEREKALRELLDCAESEVAHKENSETGGAKYWAAQDLGLSMPGVDRRIMLARAVLVARAVLSVKPTDGAEGR